MLVFHPKVASSLAGLLIFVLIVIFVRAHVVTHAVFVVLVMLVVLILSMVVMCMATAHGREGHGEGFEVFRFKFKNVLAFLKVVNGHRRAGRAFAIGE